MCIQKATKYEIMKLTVMDILVNKKTDALCANN